ncbi:MAG: glycosyltransferase family 2 protein [Nitrospinae bacterium]|nr:glycosyltransferase family 2 protein [Nitrospinota bacterium]MBL7019574.1 glycosyltransferase family 2 protein [Nitrospinaceae bacterium]
MTAFQFKERLDLSIIIVSFNTRDVLLDCLTSVYAQTEGISYEVIVVDNASSDDTPAAVSENFPDVRLISNDVNGGFSSANNQGIRESTGKCVALLNPDTRLIENSFQKICGYLQEHKEFSILGPGIIDESSQQSSTRLWEDTPLDAARKILGFYNPGDELQRMGDEEEALVISGCCFVVHRELFEEIGLLDENYFLYNEEDDFCRRARKHGKRICFFPETSIQHLQGKSTHQPEHREKVIVEAYKSNLYFYSKYYSCGWNFTLRSLYKLTFLAGLIRSAFRHLTGSATSGAEDSLRLKLKLLFLL